MDNLQIEITPEQGGVQVFKLSGPFTISTMFDFQQLVREHIAPVTLIDLGAVPYMDSAALGALLGFHVSCGREGRKYGLVAVSDRLKTLFQVAGVEGILVGYPTVAAAKAAVAA
jgi:anti-anti-sigma factor